MPKTDMKLLRDELAESIGVIRRLSEQLQAADKRNAELEMLLAEYTMKYELAAAERDAVTKERDVAVKERDEALAKVERLEDALQKVSEGKIDAEKALAYYDNAHAPPSNDTITQKEINAEKKAERKKKNPTGRRGRKKGCKNTAISRKAERTVRYTPEKCSECGGKNLRVTGAENDMVYDIPYIPKAVMTNHIAETCTCDDCGAETAADPGMPKKTIFGPNLLRVGVSMWDANGTDQKIADVFSGLFGVDKCAKSTIQHALDAAADRMEPEADRIAAEMVTKEVPVNIDETPFSACGSTGQAWLATDADATQVKVAGSRGAAVLMEHFPFFHRPATTDGLAVYGVFETRQRCWAHILRDSDRHVRAARKRFGASSRECREAEIRHAKLQLIYHEAKQKGTATEAECEAFVERTVRLAETYPKKMANYLKAAAPYLFTFLRHEGMEGTNNPAERGVRPIVVRRKISGQIGSAKGMRRMGILFTCLLTWRKKNLNVYQELERVLAPK